MDPNEYAALERTSWEDALAGALDDLEGAGSARIAFAAAGMIRQLVDRSLPVALVNTEVVRRACDELAAREPERTVARAIDAEGELGEERRQDVWMAWSEDAAAFAALKLGVAGLGYPPPMARALDVAAPTLREWERAIRCRWDELAPYGLGLAEAQVGAWRPGGGASDLRLFHELLDWAEAERASPGSYEVCPFGFGVIDAEDHEVLPEDDSDFGRHVAACAICARRVEAAAGDGGVEPETRPGGRVVHLRVARPMAAASAPERWSIEHDDDRLGNLRIWRNEDGVLVVAPERFADVEAVSVSGVVMTRDDVSRHFALGPESTRVLVSPFEFEIAERSGREPLVLRIEFS